LSSNTVRGKQSKSRSRDISGAVDDITKQYPRQAWEVIDKAIQAKPEVMCACIRTFHIQLRLGTELQGCVGQRRFQSVNLQASQHAGRQKSDIVLPVTREGEDQIRKLQSKECRAV
jgi:hypothetical protein